MDQLVELIEPERIRTDVELLKALRAYHQNHTGNQVKQLLNKIWPSLRFVFTSGEASYWLLEEYLDVQQGHDYIESLGATFQGCSSAD